MSRLIDRLFERQWLPAAWLPDKPIPKNLEQLRDILPRKQLRRIAETLKADLDEKTDGVRDQLVKMLDGAMVLVADNVATYIRESDDEKLLSIADCPNATPPFQKLWIEADWFRDGCIGGLVEALQVSTLTPDCDSMVWRQSEISIGAKWIIKVTVITESGASIYPSGLITAGVSDQQGIAESDEEISVRRMRWHVLSAEVSDYAPQRAILLGQMSGAGALGAEGDVCGAEFMSDLAKQLDLIMARLQYPGEPTSEVAAVQFIRDNHDAIRNALEAVEKLPKTADGVPVTLGQQIWISRELAKTNCQSIYQLGFEPVFEARVHDIHLVDNGPIGCTQPFSSVEIWPPKRAIFSTREAALAAAEKKPEAK